ncbi:MAG: FtsW/RodA/SpoVE family cell cycle protein [Erysipelotrichaceae bacterium]|nr:FtsW/RodA/SpoVE family cell cycle protein [Erysipelotrichaceae bacterium]
MRLFQKKDAQQEIPVTPVSAAETEPVQTEKGSGYIVIPILLEFVLGAFVWIQAPAAALTYLYCLVPMLLLSAFIGTYVYNRDGDMKLFAAVASLSAIGIALQLVIDEVYTTYTVFSPLKAAAAVVIAIVFVLLYDLLRKLLNHSFSIYIMLAFSIAIYAVLYFWGYDPNGMGTSAWVRAGPITVQLTDFTKIAAVMFYSSLFSSKENRSETSILVLSNAFFLINLAGSVIIHELGSFFILYFLHISVLYIFMEKGNKKRNYLLALAGLTVAALGTCFVLYRYLRPIAEAGGLNSITSILWPIVRKVYLRFSVTANIYFDPYGAGYQLLQGKKALWIAGLFGNRVNFNAIPVVESDMAFIALVNSFGMIMGFIAILFFVRIMRSGSKLCMRLLETSKADAVVVYGLTVLLFAQAMLVILGSCNIIPLAGLPIPFLSRGGTYQALVFSFCGLLLHMSEYQGSRYEGGEADESETF